MSNPSRCADLTGSGRGVVNGYFSMKGSEMSIEIEDIKKTLRNQALGLFMLKSPLAILHEMKNKEDTWSKILF